MIDSSTKFTIPSYPARNNVKAESFKTLHSLCIFFKQLLT